MDDRQLQGGTHERAHERRGRVWIVRGVPLRSLALGLVGKADVVEFEPPEVTTPENLPPGRLFEHLRQAGTEGWRVTPVEYKRGRPKKGPFDAVQLCAQAVCLEEMLGVRIASGALFYGRTRRRTEVPLDGALRELLAATARRLHELIASGRTPPAVREAKCDACSLVDLCLPRAAGSRPSAVAFAEQPLGGGRLARGRTAQEDQCRASGPRCTANEVPSCDRPMIHDQCASIVATKF